MEQSSAQKKSETTGQHPELFRRRAFLRSAGLATASTALLLSGCKEYLEKLPIPVDVNPDDYVVQTAYLGKGDTGILNYAYTLEQLEAAFYISVAAAPMFAALFGEAERKALLDIRDHEIAHRDFFKAALGSQAIGNLKFNFKAVDFSSRDSILGTAKTFEDLGVAAYNSAGRRLMSKDLLLIAGKIVSVEARHAAAIRDIFDADPASFAGDDVVDMNGLDRAFEPKVVLAAASPFIVNKIDASELQ